MDMFGNTKEKEREREREKKKMRKRNRKCYYVDLTPSWQGSIMPCLLLLFLLSFVLEKVFLIWHNDMIIYWVGQGISSLVQWLDNPIYSRSYKGFTYELCLKKFNTENNLEASQGVFWSQNWILLVVSFDSCLH